MLDQPLPAEQVSVGMPVDGPGPPESLHTPHIGTLAPFFSTWGPSWMGPEELRLSCPDAFSRAVSSMLRIYQGQLLAFGVSGPLLRTRTAISV